MEAAGGIEPPYGALQAPASTTRPRRQASQPICARACASWAAPARRGRLLHILGSACAPWAAPAHPGRRLRILGGSCARWAVPPPGGVVAPSPEGLLNGARSARG